jgi:hypothetical protein
MGATFFGANTNTYTGSMAPPLPDSEFYFAGDFSKGTHPTLLESDQAQIVKKFIETMVYQPRYIINLLDPPTNEFKVEYVGGKVVYTLNLRTALKYDNDPHLGGSYLTMGGGSFKCNTYGTRFFQYGADGFIVTPQNGFAGTTDDAFKTVIKWEAWDGTTPYHVGFVCPNVSDLSASGDLDAYNGIVWTLPFEAGTDGQMLKTDGANNLSWADGAGRWYASDHNQQDNPNKESINTDTLVKWLDEDGSVSVVLSEQNPGAPNDPVSWFEFNLKATDQLFAFDDGANQFLVKSSGKSAGGYDTVTFTSSDASVTIDCSLADTIDLTAAAGASPFPLSSGNENEAISLTSSLNPQRVQNILLHGGGSGTEKMIQWLAMSSSADEYNLGWNDDIDNAGSNNSGLCLWANRDTTGGATDYVLFDAYSALVSTGQAQTISICHHTHTIDNTDTSWGVNPGLDICNDGRIIFRTDDPTTDDNEYCTIWPTSKTGNTGEFTIPSNDHNGLAADKRNGIVDTTDPDTGARDLKWADVLQGDGEFSTVAAIYGSGLHVFADGAGSHQHAIRSGNMIKFIGGTDITCTTELTYDGVNNQVLKVTIDSDGGGGGGGTVTSVNGTGTNGISVTGGPITTSGTLTVNLDDTAVTPDTYGDANNVAQITVDQQGRITDCVEVAIAGGGGGGAPVGASYVCISADGTLTNERVLTAGAGITVTDGGANGNVTIAATAAAGAPADAQYVTLALDGDLTAERVLTAGANITITDGGADGNVTIATTTAALTVMEVDTFPTVTSVNTIKFTNGTVTDDGGGVVTVDVSGGGGGSGMTSFVCTEGANPFTIDSTANTLTFAAEAGLAWDFGVGGTAKITHTLMDEFFVSDGANSWNVEDADTFEISSSDGFVMVDCSFDRIVDLTDGLSDESVKDNVQPLTGAWDRVSKLRAVEFDWNEGAPQESGFCEARTGGKHDFGFVAQEVEKVVPEIVGTRRDGKKTVKYSKLTPMLLDCIQDLKAEIELLKGKVEELERK